MEGSTGPTFTVMLWVCYCRCTIIQRVRHVNNVIYGVVVIVVD
jgi:acyl-ACP thioesterase